MEYVTHIFAWIAMSAYIASTAFEGWEKYRHRKELQKLERAGVEHPFFGDGLE